jgi:hypothetical protein
MGFPIYYNGKILFRNGKPAFSTRCCCGPPSPEACRIDCIGAIGAELFVEGVELAEDGCSDCLLLNGYHFIDTIQEDGPGACAWVRQQLNVCGLYDWSVYVAYGAAQVNGSDVDVLNVALANLTWIGNCVEDFNDDGTVTLTLDSDPNEFPGCVLPTTIRARIVFA